MEFFDVGVDDKIRLDPITWCEEANPQLSLQGGALSYPHKPALSSKTSSTTNT
jgi:hypothetical protein